MSLSATENSLSISNPHPRKTDAVQKLGIALTAIGLIILFAAWYGITFNNSALFLLISLGTIFAGTLIYGIRTYLNKHEGIKNDHVMHDPMTNRGVWAYAVGIGLTGFYILLYWFPWYLGLGQDGASNVGLVALFDPLSQFFKGKPASQWFVYGTLYTLAILALGIKFIFKYRHTRYHLIRTIVVIISQLFLAYLIPEIMEGLNQGAGDTYFSKDLKYFWPLNYYFFEEWHLNNMQQEGGLGMFYMVWGIIGFTVLTPIITYFVGKRWYCSWVCGCGGLAETAGDPYRHLSDKRLDAWQIERVLIHGVLVLITLVTAWILYSYFTGTGFQFGMNKYLFLGLFAALGAGLLLLQKKKTPHVNQTKTIIVVASVFAIVVAWFMYNMGNTVTFSSNELKQWYGFFIGATFSGVIGVGFYPILGNRVWCRFGCPMAGYMGLVQRFKSKFRITTNGGQCISCGNCSTYCEQGIDVRWYAQRGQNIVRASCVGCGICSAVCPRGVLKLENGPEEKRLTDNPIIIGNDGYVGLEKEKLNK